MNHNVRLSLIFTFLAGTSRGIWAFSVLSGYLYVLTNSNFLVGLAEGIQGTAQAVVAIPAGIYLTDGIGRDKTLKISGVWGAITIACTLLVLLGTQRWGSSTRFSMLCVVMAMWGGYQALWKGSLESIYADSLREDRKSEYLVYKFIITILSNTAGPVTGICLFLWRGDTWTMPELTVVFSVGVSVMVLAVIALFFFDDRRTLGDESEAAFGRGIPNPGTGGKGIQAYDRKEEILVDYGVGFREDEGEVVVNGNENEEPLLEREDSDHGPGATEPLDREDRRRGCLGFLSSRGSVPYIIVTSDVLMGLGSGMTIKFFPLFFKNEAKLSPVTTLLIYVCTFPLMSLCSKLAQHVSDPSTGCMARPAVCLLTSYSGISLLVIMSLMKSIWQTWYLICPIYVVRTAIMNCNYPIRKSMLMNFVPKKTRGRWNSIDSITRFGWSGSALLGGYLADSYGYGFSFLVTAAIQFMGVSMWWLLVPLVPR